MTKIEWKPGNMLYPLPAVLVTSMNKKGQHDVCTVAWAGTVCTNPPMVSISLRPSRLSYDYICETGVFVINVTTEKLVRETDYCGVRSGRDEDKFEKMSLQASVGPHTGCMMLDESPVNIECKVALKKALGSHTMFIANVVAVHVDQALEAVLLPAVEEPVNRALLVDLQMICVEIVDEVAADDLT